MSDEIKPALTPEQWRELRLNLQGTVEIERASNNDLAAMADYSRHALAALALYGQPFGFTHKMVSYLWGLHGLIEGTGWLNDTEGAPLENAEAWIDLGSNELVTMRAIIARIAALLPPESHSTG